MTLEPGHIVDHLENIVHADTQQHEAGFDLTAAQIEALTAPGRIDFGGSELQAPSTRQVETKPRDPDDAYGWWRLEEGTYLLTYNEDLALEATQRLLLTPRLALVEQGVHHPTPVVQTLPHVPLSVPPSGARIKRNARVSTLMPLGPA